MSEDEALQRCIDAMRAEIDAYEKQMRRQDRVIKYMVLAGIVACIIFYCHLLVLFGY